MRFLNVKELSHMTGIPESSVYAYSRRVKNPLPHYRAGRRYLFKEDEVIDWMRGQANHGKHKVSR